MNLRKILAMLPDELESSLRDDLDRGLETLSPEKLKLVLSVVKALNAPVAFTPGHRSDVVNEAFVAAMSDSLVLHHSLHEEALNKKPFEYVFRKCLLAQGNVDARLNQSPGAFSFDVFGAGQRWSLKTEAAKGISRARIKVEKLMEARWIRGSTAEECAAQVRDRLPHHLSGYDRILIMRAFFESSAVVYRLEEIPISVLRECFLAATGDMFLPTDVKPPKTPSYGANFVHPRYPGKEFRVLLDASVEKVRLSFPVELATNHGTWTLSNAAPLNQEQLTIPIPSPREVGGA